jgi:hypothetical protein
LENVPAEHAVQLVELMLLTVPGAQGEHSETLATVPASQPRQSSKVTELIVPEGHTEQVAEPGAIEKYPGSQEVQTTDPTELSVPAGHCEQTFPFMKNPASQATQYE